MLLSGFPLPRITKETKKTRCWMKANHQWWLFAVKNWSELMWIRKYSNNKKKVESKVFCCCKKNEKWKEEKKKFVLDHFSLGASSNLHLSQSCPNKENFFYGIQLNFTQKLIALEIGRYFYFWLLKPTQSWQSWQSKQS